MSTKQVDETCGTCRLFVPDAQRPGKGACMEDADVRIGDINFYTEVQASSHACGSHEERQDSVGNVMRDMLFELSLLATAAGKACIQSAALGRRESFCERLREMGVDV